MKPRNAKTTTETITPTVAAEYLAKNHPKNRPIRPHRVKGLVEDLQKGRWQLTHQGIAFDDEGRLIDGQHRLTAIIAAGVSAPMMVTRGLDISTFAVLDQGGARSAADVMCLSNRYVASLRCYVGLETYNPNFAHLHVSDLEERAQRGLDDLTRTIQSIKGGRTSGQFFTGAVFAALAYARPIAQQAVEDFAEQVRSGELLSRTDPAYRFREWMQTKSRGAPPWDVAMMTLQAFHHLIIDGDKKIAHLYLGEIGYKAVTTQRRVKRIPETPSAKEVAAVSRRIDAAALR